MAPSIVSCVLAFCFAEVASASSISTYGRVPNAGYIIDPKKIEDFKENGYTTLENVLTEEVQEIEKIYDRFMNREIKVPGKDFCDMSKPFDTPFEEYSIINCMLPTKYYPPLKGNVYEKIVQSISEQVYPDADMTQDYDQLLNKRPQKEDAIFGWHQDMAYWPTKKLTPDTRTITFSLAIDSTTQENGCLKFVPKSGLSQTLRNHKPLHSSREEGHAVEVEMFSNDTIQSAMITRGSLTLHDEYVVHGSGGNDSNGDRRTYVIAFRPLQTVKKERSLGFTHSHNDETNWDTFKDLEKDMAPTSEL